MCNDIGPDGAEQIGLALQVLNIKFIVDKNFVNKNMLKEKHACHIYKSERQQNWQQRWHEYGSDAASK